MCSSRERGRDGPTNAPLYEGLCAYLKKETIGFHTPGHAGGRAFALAPLMDLDLTEIMLGPEGPCLPQLVAEAERLAAAVFGAGRTFFLTNGASIGVLAMILGTCPPDGTIVVGRDCHSSVVHACVLGDLKPVFLPPTFVPGWEFPMGANPFALGDALRRGDPVLATNPTYQGVVWDLGDLGEAGGTLLVDEAHGAHLILAGGHGGAKAADALAWVHGSHKTLGSLTQTGMLHLRAGLDPEPYAIWLERLGSTSPSYPLLASLDLARRWAVEYGRAAWAGAAERLARFRERLGCFGWRILAAGDLPDGAALDPAKLTVAVPEGGLSFARLLLGEYGIQVEAAGPDWITFLITPFHTEDELTRLEGALVSHVPPATRREPSPAWPRALPARILWPREAAFGPRRRVPLAGSEGLIAAEALSPYPPGIPLIWPGEVIDAASIAYLLAVIEAGGMVHGIDPDGRTAVVAI